VPPKRERNSGIQRDEHVALWRQIKLFHAIKINHRVPMNPQEPFRVKLRLQRFQGSTKQVAGATRVKSNIIAGRLYPINIFYSESNIL
jgi:hypothetical protein